MPVQADCSFWLGLSITITLSTLFIRITSAQEEFITPSNAQCACRGDVLVYTCTAVGAGSTKWNGTAFSCENNEIILRHSLYDDNGGTSGDCNGGAIVGRSVGVAGAQLPYQYTSQLTVTIDERVSSNRTVMCVFNIEHVIGSSVLEVVSAAYPPPSDVRLVNAYTDNITFNWSSVSLSNCSASLHYIITSNGCGECPSVTNSTNVTCSNLTVPSMCSLSVKSVVCGFEGVASGPLAVTLKLPEAKPTIAVIPHYLNSTGGLVNLTVQVAINETSMNISNETEDVLRVKGYNISYSNSMSGDILNWAYVPISSATSTINELMVSVPSVCQNSAINVSVSAVNQLGQGPSPDHVTIACRLSDTFVEVLYTQESNAISCIFRDRLDDENSCSAAYGKCDIDLNYSVPENRTMDSSGTIRLRLQPQFADQTFCYVVRATSAGESIIVEGSVSRDVNRKPDIGSTIAAGVAGAVLLIVLISICVIVITVCYKRNNAIQPVKENRAEHQRSSGQKLKLDSEKLEDKDEDQQSSRQVSKFDAEGDKADTQRSSGQKFNV